ncbi:hypothetical protein BST61_g6092 [Cercospora zeina]
MTAVQDALCADAKAAKEGMSQRLESLNKELRSTNTQIEKIFAIGEDTKGAAKEAVEVKEPGTVLLRLMPELCGGRFIILPIPVPPSFSPSSKGNTPVGRFNVYCGLTYRSAVFRLALPW